MSQEVSRASRFLKANPEIDVDETAVELLVSELGPGASLSTFLDAAGEAGLLDAGEDVDTGGRPRAGYWRERAFAHACGWTFHDFLLAPEIPDSILQRIPPKRARALKVVPVGANQSSIVFACADPDKPGLNQQLQDAVSAGVEFAYAPLAELTDALDKFYSIEAETRAQAKDAAREFGGRQRVVVSAEQETNQSRLLNTLVEGAIAGKEADIHIEPGESGYVIRYGKGSVLRHVEDISSEAGRALVRLIKTRAKMKTAQFAPQDAAYQHSMRGKTYDMRVAVLPTIQHSENGGAGDESVTIRLGQEEIRSLTELNMNPETLARLVTQIENSNGLFLSCGPMGSGKSTLMYAIVEQLSGADRKIVTLEAPVEYRFGKFVTQVQVDNNHVTWDGAMATILRSAASTLMIGELNRKTIAHTATEAANTGHQVFSTVHTNDAAGVIPRLREWGVPVSVMADVMRMVCAQRLPYALCQSCKVTAPPAQKYVDLFEVNNTVLANGAWAERNPTGCHECRGTGLGGRLPLHELMTFGPAVKDAIWDNAPTSTIKQAAIADGMKTLAFGGVALAYQGLASLSEVRKHVTF